MLKCRFELSRSFCRNQTSISGQTVTRSDRLSKFYIASNTLLLVLHIQHVILVSRLCWFKRSLEYSSACAAHPACYLGFEIMLIQTQSLHQFTELFGNHKCCKTCDHKYWMPTLVKRITVFQKTDWWSLHFLPLAKFYNRVCSAIMFTSLNSTIYRSQAQFLWTLCAFLFSNDNSWCLGSYGYFKLAFFGLHYSGCFHLEYSRIQRTLVQEGVCWLWSWLRNSFSVQELRSTCASFPSILFFSSWSLRPCSRAWLRTNACSLNITGQFTSKCCWWFCNFSRHGFLAPRLKLDCHSVTVTILVMYVDNHGFQHNCEDLVQWFEKFVVLTMNPGRRRLGLSAHPWQSR